MAGGYKPSRSEAMVDFPEPDEPTIAIHCPLRIIKLRSDRAGAPGRDGYENVRCEILTGPERVFESCGSSFNLPACSCEVRNGSLASRRSREALSLLDEICGIKAMAAATLEVLDRSIVKTIRTALTEKSCNRTTFPPYQKINAVTKWMVASEQPKKKPQIIALLMPTVNALLVALVYFL
jgi:hypothetical protein